MASTDGLTQLQSCLDQLATQMFASLFYVSHRSSLARIPGQRYQGSLAGGGAAGPPITQSPSAQAALDQPPSASNETAAAAETGKEETGAGDDKEGTRPDTPTTFRATLHELARDLVAKQGQIEDLVNALAGLDRDETRQEHRLKELDAEMEVVRLDLLRAKQAKEVLLERVEEAVVAMPRYV